MINKFIISLLLGGSLTIGAMQMEVDQKGKKGSARTDAQYMQIQPTVQSMVLGNTTPPISASRQEVPLNDEQIVAKAIGLALKPSTSTAAKPSTMMHIPGNPAAQDREKKVRFAESVTVTEFAKPRTDDEQDINDEDLDQKYKKERWALWTKINAQIDSEQNRRFHDVEKNLWDLTVAMNKRINAKVPAEHAPRFYTLLLQGFKGVRGYLMCEYFLPNDTVQFDTKMAQQAQMLNEQAFMQKMYHGAEIFRSRGF